MIAVSVFFNRRLLARARAIQEDTGIRPVTWWKSLAILFVPIIALLVALGFHLEYPEITRFNFTGGIEVLHSFTALLIALSLYTAAFIAEIVRAGIMAISKGQTEAAFALGLRPGRTMKPDHPAAGAAGHHPAADQPVPEPDQEHLACHRGQLHGPARHARAASR